MAKRFTSTEIWDEDWFLNLPKEQMLLWMYIKDSCNHAGIWRVNKKKFEFAIGGKVNIEQFFKSCNSDKERIMDLGNGKWYLKGFISFQYGNILNKGNKVHLSILNELNACKIDTSCFEVKEGSSRPQEELNEALKDKDKEKDIVTKGKRGVGEETKKRKKILTVEEYIEENKDYLAQVFGTNTQLKRSAKAWLEYKWRRNETYKTTSWADKMVERASKTNTDFVCQKISDTIAGEKHQDYFYDSTLADFVKLKGTQQQNGGQQSKKQLTNEERRNM
jgi:hypothetical protein